jgi:hypothetical protein
MPFKRKEEHDKKLLLKRVDEISSFLFDSSSIYCKEISGALDAKQFDVVYFEIVVYFLFHLDFYMVKNKLDTKLRELINHSIDHHIFKKFGTYYHGTISDLVNMRLEQYSKIVNECGFYTDDYLESIFFYFSQLLHNSSKNDSLTTWEMFKSPVELGIFKNYSLLTKIQELEEKHLIPFRKMCKELVTNENFIP